MFSPAVECPLPPLPAFGGFHGGNDKYLYGNQITYYCDSSFSLVGENVVNCSSDGTWKPETPTCQSKLPLSS